MDVLKNALQLASAGRYGQALASFPEAPKGTEPNLFYAELLERTGNYSLARSISELLLKAKNLSTANRSTCESILGLVAMQEGDLDRSMVHLQRAATLATEAGFLERACWSRLRFLLILSDRSGPDAILTHLPDLRSSVLRAGTSHLLA